MELRDVRSFLLVAQMGSVTLAAERLSVTQPAVTQHIHALERHFGVALFDRTRQGMRLTRAGRAARKRLSELVKALDTLRGDIGSTQEEISGEVAIGSAIALTDNRITLALKAFIDRYPHTRLAVRMGRSEEVCGWLLEHEVELAISGWLPREATLRGIPLFTQRFVLAAPTDHPFARRTIPRSKLKALTLIRTVRGQWLGVDWNAILPELQYSRLEGDTLESIRCLVSAGAGCAFLPEEDVRAEIERGTLATINIAGAAPIQRTVYALVFKGSSVPPSVRLLIRHLQESGEVVTRRP